MINCYSKNEPALRTKQPQALQAKRNFANQAEIYQTTIAAQYALFLGFLESLRE